MSSKHGLGFRLVALAVGLCALPAIELAAAAAERAWGRPANEIFYTRVFERRGGVMATRAGRLGFFLDQQFPAQKSSGTVRIFILGGSSALGFPYQGQYGLAELLRSALPVVRGGRSYEVVNAAGFGYNSARVAAVAEEVLDYEPDALVVMTGHNEFLERRAGGAWEFAAGRLAIGMERRLRGRQDTVRWEGHEVTAAERKRVEAGVEAALRRVADKARIRGVKLILVSCPSNLGYRPHGPGAVPEAVKKNIDDLFRAGKAEAVDSLLVEQQRRVPDDAWVMFMRACRAQAAGDARATTAAGRMFASARDYDPRPVRASSAINEIIRRVARDAGATLADAEKAFIGSPAPGAEEIIFLDHCHPSFLGQATLALSVLDGLARAGLVPAPDVDRMAAMRQKWDRDYAALPQTDRAEFFYRAAFEAGVNMQRPCRGFRLAEDALMVDPGHAKAAELRERLKPGRDAGCLTGD